MRVFGCAAAFTLLCVAQCPHPQPPLAPSPPPPPFTLCDLISRILPMCVRAGQESREAVRSLRSVFCVWTASNCSISCTQRPQLLFFLKKRKTLKLNIERRSVYLQLHLDFYCYLVQRANCCHPPGSAPLSKACSRSLISRRTSDRRPT